MEWTMIFLMACSGAKSVEDTAETLEPSSEASTEPASEASGEDTQVEASSYMVYVNEVLAKTDVDPADWIELYNAEAEAVDLSGFGLQDSAEIRSFLDWVERRMALPYILQTTPHLDPIAEPKNIEGRHLLGHSYLAHQDEPSTHH